MEFDKSKVCTAVNAEDLPIGSKCIFADTVIGLKNRIQEENAADHAMEFIKLYKKGIDNQFAAGDGYIYNYAYLIESPAEPKYKPFESNKKAFEATKAHGGWVKHKKAEFLCFIVGIDIEGEDEPMIHKPMIQMNNDWYEVDKLFENYVFADDGSPCGELVKE